MSRHQSRKLSILLIIALIGALLLGTLYALMAHPDAEIAQGRAGTSNDTIRFEKREEVLPGALVQIPAVPEAVTVEAEKTVVVDEPQEANVPDMPEQGVATTDTSDAAFFASDTQTNTESGELLLSPVGNLTVDETPPFDPFAVAEAARNTIEVDRLGRPLLNNSAHHAVLDTHVLQFAPVVPEPDGLASHDNGKESTGKPGQRLVKLFPMLQETSTITSGQMISSSVPLTLSIALANVAIGEDVLFSSPSTASPQIQDNMVRYTHTQSLVEEFIALDAGIEQQWWLLSEPTLTGDLVVTVDISTAVTITLQGGNLVFAIEEENGNLTPIAQYSRALAVDANGQSEWASMQVALINGTGSDQHHFQISITFTESWLAAASYPILIDPLVSSMFRLEQETPGHDQITPDIAYNPDADEYLLVWQDYRSGTDWGIYGQRVAANGALLDENFVIADGPYNQRFPKVAYGGGVYLAAWRHYPGTSTYYYDT
ncbi:MAG: hypothetical protein KC415_23590, partial [Anaerolineales bacterium]|nr:hypothetical protein [Anaerolineales bacterium]